MSGTFAATGELLYYTKTTFTSQILAVSNFCGITFLADIFMFRNYKLL